MYSDHSHHKEAIVCVTDSPSVKGSGTPRKVKASSMFLDSVLEAVVGYLGTTIFHMHT